MTINNDGNHFDRAPGERNAHFHLTPEPYSVDHSRCHRCIQSLVPCIRQQEESGITNWHSVRQQWLAISAIIALLALIVSALVFGVSLIKSGANKHPPDGESIGIGSGLCVPTCITIYFAIRLCKLYCKKKEEENRNRENTPLRV